MDEVFELMNKVNDKQSVLSQVRLKLFSDCSGALLNGMSREIFSFYGKDDLVKKLKEELLKQ